MTDMTSTDLGPFFKRYDDRQRLLFVAAISASLVLSAVILMHLRMTGWTGPTPVGFVLGFGVVFPPLFIVVWWTFAELMGRGRRKASQPDGRHLASADDARNGVRVANAGFVFNVGLMAAMVAEQAFWASVAFGYPVGLLIPRVTTILAGAVTIYLGNLWPRMPTPRAPAHKAAAQMKIYRFSGWVMVIVGLLVVLLGLFLPLLRYRP